MLRIYMAYISEEARLGKYEEKIIKTLPRELRLRCESLNSHERARERIFAYDILVEVMKNKPQEKVCFSELGRPYIESGRFDISVSHSENLVAVAVCDLGAVGIDIEMISEKSESVAERFCNKYIGDLDFDAENIDKECFEIYSYVKKEKSEIYKEKISNQRNICIYDGKKTSRDNLSEKNENLRRWCFAEAILKSDGGGFASLPYLREISQKNRVFDEVIEIGNKIFQLAVAIKLDVL